jgi:CheY-like chemotaxis protein
VISVDDQKKRGLRAGAFGFLEKPVDRDALMKALARTREFIDRPVKSLLLVEDDANQRMSMVELLRGGDVEVTDLGSAKAALEAVQAKRFDCAIIDLGLPDMPGAELIEGIRSIRGSEELPVIVYTGMDLTRAEEGRLESIASTIIVKGSGAPEKLLSETTLFLHKSITNGSDGEEPQPIRLERPSEMSLQGRKVLIVDDDVRNIFSLTSALEQHGMNVAFAENGREGIEMLKNTPDVDVMLVDIMMPEMDGFETMQEIRKMPEYRDLPLIAVTAKAMKGDREKCLESGATDYVSKPVDMDQLLAVLRIQLAGSSYRPTARSGAAMNGLPL